MDAHKRGVKIAVILDAGQKTAKYSSADFIAHARITTLIDAKHAIAHNKVMVIDGLVLILNAVLKLPKTAGLKLDMVHKIFIVISA